MRKLLQEVDVFWFRLGYRLNESVLDTQSRCRYLVTPVTGIDHIDEKLCAQLGIQIICLRGETAFLREIRATAEHTLLLMMMLMRRAGTAQRDVEAGHWRRDLFRGYELHHKRIGIVGLGRLGYIVAEYLEAMGCNIGFVDIVDKEYPSSWRRFPNLSTCIRESDIITIHIPYNESTHQLFDAQLLAHFDAHKWLVNTSRGGVIDENALLQLLQTGQLAGAALDVVQGEPDIQQNPLWQYAQQQQNLLLTPHIGGCTYESFAKTEAFVANKLEQAIANEA